MKRIQSFIFSSLILLTLFSCNKTSNNSSNIIEYNDYIQAFTGGSISNNDNITIRFSKDVSDARIGKQVADGILSITPQVDGVATWDDMQTIVFKPTRNYNNNQTYNVKVNLNELFKDAKGTFNFDVSVIAQNYRLQVDEITPYSITNLKDNKIKCTLFLNDYADINNIHKTVNCSQNGKNLTIKWLENNTQNVYPFIIEHVKRGNENSYVEIECNGNPIGIDKNINKKIELISIDKFIIKDAKLTRGATQSVKIIFSDPLNPNQNLDGLITFSDQGISYTTNINNNTIEIKPEQIISGDMSITIHKGIKNINNKSIDTNKIFEFNFSGLKPAVKFIGKGNILPNSKGLTLPFKAVSLKSVQVNVIKIFENNIAHFLQNNTLAGSSNIRQAGRLIKRKTIKLDNDPNLDLGKWNAFSINLDKIINVDPGAIYRVELRFARRNAIVPCDEEISENSVNTIDPDIITEAEIKYYDNPEYYSYYDNYNNYYNWSERNDPCKQSYYTSSKYATKNILASDMGLIVKKGTTNELTAIVSNLINTTPMKGVDIEARSYQNQIVGKGKTNSKGIAKLEVKGTPFLLIAKSGKMRAYQRLDEASALSLTNFDVGGKVIEKGLKGFIYGERDVWRPGDTLHISFILEDQNNTLPKKYPIVFELCDPNGRLVSRLSRNLNKHNIYLFDVNTAPDAITGNWEARVVLGGTVFTKRVKIETIKPNRLKINLDFQSKLLSQQSSNASLNVSWLQGGEAKNLKTIITANLLPIKTKFKGFTNYVFDDPAYSTINDEINIFDGKLNSQGKASIPININVEENAPGMLGVLFRTRVFEESGDFSVNFKSIHYSPFNSYVGIKTPEGDKRGILLTDKNHTINIASVSESGKPISSNNITYEIFKISWRWWWEAGEDNLARYVRSSVSDFVTRGTTKTVNGKGSFNFKIEYPQWGRYFVRVIDNNSGHSTGKIIYVDWPGYATKSHGENSDAATILSLSSDKTKYEVGEKATVSFPSTKGCKALVSIENASKVIKEYWVKTEDKVTNFDFELTKEMSPNVYVYVTLLQQYEQTKNNLPIRMFGVTPIMVEDSKTHLHPKIEVANVLRPEKKAKIVVKEENGQPMAFTVAVVEEGLLDITSFKTPQPWNYFYAREALGVHTWDIYNKVLGAYGGQIEQVFGIGGGNSFDKKKNLEDNVNRFKPVDLVFGPYEIKKGGKKVIEFTMPRYIGAVRTMVVARNKSAYGSAEKSSAVREDLMALATLPRVLGPNEEVDLPVTVFTGKDNMGEIKVNLKCNDNISILGEDTKTIEINKKGSKVITFRIKVLPTIGKGKIEVTASAEGKIAVDAIDIAIRNPNPDKVKSISLALNPNEEKTFNYEKFGMKGSNSMSLELSSITNIDFGKRLQFLISYPHGCVEQTTSSVFPQLFLSKFTELDEETKIRCDKNIKAGIQRLSTFITSDGGMSYWPHGNRANDWGTSYAGQYLLEAEKLAYVLPVNWKRNWLKYQKRAAKSFVEANSNSSYLNLAQAYRLYTLALAGHPDKSSMNRMRNSSTVNNICLWQLAGAYALCGQDNVAKDIIDKLPLSSDDNENRYTYGSVTRNEAIILNTLLLIKDYDKAQFLIKKIAAKLSSKSWLSTQTTAYSLIALSRLVNDDEPSLMSFSYNGSGIESKDISTNKMLNIQKLPSSMPKKGRVNVKNNTNKILFANLILKGTPLVGQSYDENKNIIINVTYRSLDGKIIDVSKLEQGTDFMAEVIINKLTHINIENIAMTQIFPSGWEIRNTRLEESSNKLEGDIPRYRDIRDDRVYTYFSLNNGKSKRFRVLLNATYKGKFYLPAVDCRAMYDNNLYARKAGQWVEVY